MKKSRVPHSYVIVFMILILATIATFVVPAGAYERVKNAAGRTVVKPDTFKYVKQKPVGPFDMVAAIPKGMTAGAGIVFFIFLVGGAFSIIQATGAVEAVLGKAVRSLEGKEKLLIPVCMLLFWLGGASFGMAEEALPFVPLGVSLAKALGFDAIAGTAMVTMGAAAGFCCGAFNAFTVGVAQGIAELPIFSGLGFRIVCGLIFLLTGMWWVTRYAGMVKRDPSSSYVHDVEQKGELKLENIRQLEWQHSAVLLILLATLGWIVWGVMKKGWYITEIGTAFLIAGIVSGFIGKLSASNIAKAFVAGAKDLAFGALMAGFARSIVTVLEQGSVIDTIIHFLAQAVSSLPGALAGIGMFLVVTFLNPLIPAGSGLAATTMPILTPLADLVGITRQTAVLAFQFGDGFTNSIIPTSGVLMAYLAMAGIPYERWVKFIYPLMALWTALGAVMLAVATAIHYGPF
ncbi:MAG: YfcC family protein [Ignavibacteriales bacterium]